MANPVITKNDFSTLELGWGKYDDIGVTYSATTTLAPGTALAFSNTDGVYVPTVSTTAGFDNISAILKYELDLTGGETKNTRTLIQGEVDESLVVFINGTDDFDTQNTEGKTLRRVAQDVNILPRKVSENSLVDNGG
jgi:hypothetical protein